MFFCLFVFYCSVSAVANTAVENFINLFENTTYSSVLDTKYSNTTTNEYEIFFVRSF